ncbi:MAG TPA: acetyl-CoA carboxylase biotin carboxyl carrier protein [Thermoanaerobaculia bacterium]|nr:acetyl-CoA carboxylase biotin carboxyl carrier protein [Thermoanaerobaculia bacterium]
MNFKEILELIDKVAESGIGSVEVEQAGTKVRIEGKASPQTHVYAEPAPSPAPVLTAPAAAPAETPRTAAEKKAADDEAGLHVLTSPIVGTFYRAPNPEAQVFVNVGDRVTKGKVLCIIEAMKLMNEIESDVDGVVAKIFPQNGQPIEFGEPLFGIKV